MKRRTSVVVRVCTVGLLLVVSAAVASLLPDRPQQTRRDGSRITTERKMPPAVARHMKRLESLPGFGGEHPEGRLDAASEEFISLAYPGTDVPLSRLENARWSAGRLNAKFSSGRGRRGTWVSVGPSTALYPFSEFRTSAGYVPNAYVAGGRATAIAIHPDCAGWTGDDDEDEDDDEDDDEDEDEDDEDDDDNRCRLWIFAAGGGVWRTDNALSRNPSWRFLSSGFGIQSGSSIALDPNDRRGRTLYVGTGEANASGDSAAGVGMYKSTDGGDTWIGPLGASVFNGRAIGSIVVHPTDPDTIYAATTRGVLGVTSVSGGASSLIPGAAAWGLYKSTDGGNTWTFLHNGAPTAAACDTVGEAIAPGTPCSLRGVRRVALDPSNPSIVYAGSYSRGIWRSTDAGATWTQIKPSLNAADANMRPEFAVNTLLGGATRMYVYEGSSGTPSSRLFRSDSVAAGIPVFVNLSSSDPALPGYGTHNVCTGQCWYDNFVYTPAGHPDVVYVGGSYSYGESFSNKRGLVLSTDAGVTSTDMTMDATDPDHPNGLHPDQHAMVTHPRNPYQFFDVNDGGLMRSSGKFADVSHWCDTRGLAEPRLSRCRQLLSRVPTKLVGMNKGVATLQFQSLSISPFNSSLVQGGTQDNGTWQTNGNPVKWENTMIGDGGQSGFDAAEPAFRFHTFFAATPDVNFSHGAIADWNWIGDPIFFTEPQSFYVPIISDPVVSKSMYVGTSHVWRTKTWGMGAMTLEQFRQECNEWTGTFTVQCGDWVPLGDPTVAGRLTAATYGDRVGGFVVATERAVSDTSTLWAATQAGRVFVSKNVDAEPAGAVTFTRLDSLAGNDPNRFVSGIYIDPANANRAWISYSGFNAATPLTPGHVFEVTYNPGAGTATWIDLSYDMGDLPVTDVIRDDRQGTLYASTDFGVFKLEAGATEWVPAAPGLPNVEVAGLTWVPSARKLYAATHGLGAWLLNLR